MIGADSVVEVPVAEEVARPQVNIQKDLGQSPQISAKEAEDRRRATEKISRAGDPDTALRELAQPEAPKPALQPPPQQELESNPVIPNDIERVYDYIYHATSSNNMQSIAEKGLLPSGPKSKEPGTIWFNGWDAAGQYLSDFDKDEVLYRADLTKMPQLAEELDYDDTLRFDGRPVGILGIRSTSAPVPSEFLDYSLDGGKTWRHIDKEHPIPEASEELVTRDVVPEPKSVNRNTEERIRSHISDWDRQIADWEIEISSNPKDLTKKEKLTSRISTFSRRREQARTELEHPTWSAGIRSEDEKDYAYQSFFANGSFDELYSIAENGLQPKPHFGFARNIVQLNDHRLFENPNSSHDTIIRFPAGVVGRETPFLQDDPHPTYEPYYESVPYEFIDFSEDGGKTWERVSDLPGISKPESKKAA